jgi:hypothetical protein
MIRFAFASDPAGCTDDSQGSTDWFGVRLDNIDVAGVFSTNGDGAAGDSQMIPGYEMEVSGDFWEVCDKIAYSGTMSAHCPVEPNSSTPSFHLSATYPLLMKYSWATQLLRHAGQRGRRRQQPETTTSCM